MEANLSIGSSITATIDQLNTLALQHISSACFFSRQLKELEEKNKEREYGEFWTDEIFSHAKACILLTVAGLEAFINETFVRPECAKHFQGIDAGGVFDLFETRTHPILNKYDLVLFLMKADRMDPLMDAFKNVKLLIELRNSLTHYKAEWSSNEKGIHKKLAKKLEKKFSMSEFFPQGTPLFPLAWASHGCTEWAIKSSIEFIDAFETQAKLPRRFDMFKQKFKY